MRAETDVPLICDDPPEPPEVIRAFTAVEVETIKRLYPEAVWLIKYGIRVYPRPDEPGTWPDAEFCGA
jgi:hypothetical protein